MPPSRIGGTMFRRTRYQQGSLQRVGRQKGPDAWVFRWYETQIDGSRIRRKTVLGTIDQFPSESSAQTAADALRITINQEMPNLRTGQIGSKRFGTTMVSTSCPRKSARHKLHTRITPRTGYCPVGRRIDSRRLRRLLWSNGSIV